LGRRNRERIEAIREGRERPIAPERGEKRRVSVVLPPVLSLQSLGLAGPGPVGRRKGV